MNFLGHADDVDRNVNTGLWCSSCGCEFTAPHGHPVACSFCWNLLSLHERTLLPKATHREQNRVAHETEGRKRKQERSRRMR